MDSFVKNLFYSFILHIMLHEMQTRDIMYS